MPEPSINQNQPSQTTVDEPVPATWPGAFGAYKYSKTAVLFNIGPLLGLIGLSVLASIAGSLATGGNSKDTPISPVGWVVYMAVQLFSIVTSIAIIFVYIAGVKRQKANVSELLRKSLNVFLPFLGLSLLTGLIVIASLLLFIIPAFFVIPRLVLAEYYLLEGGLGVTESISASWNATRGNVGKVWGTIGVSLLIGLLIITIIGIPFAVYFGIMYGAVQAVLYFFLKNNKAAVPKAANTQNGPASPVQ